MKHGEKGTSPNPRGEGVAVDELTIADFSRPTERGNRIKFDSQFVVKKKEKIKNMKQTAVINIVKNRILLT